MILLLENTPRFILEILPIAMPIRRKFTRMLGQWNYLDGVVIGNILDLAGISVLAMTKILSISILS